VDIEAHDDFNNDEDEVEGDADDKGPVDLFEVNGMMMVAETVGVAMVVVVVVTVIVGVVVAVFVIVGVCGIHEGVLSVVISCGCKGVDDLAVGVGIGGVGDIGRDRMGSAGGKEVFFSTDDHFQFAIEDEGNLFVGVAVFEQPATFFDFPDGERAFVAMHHFPKKTRPYFFGWDVGKILHERFWGEGKKNWEITERREALGRCGLKGMRWFVAGRMGFATYVVLCV